MLWFNNILGSDTSDNTRNQGVYYETDCFFTRKDVRKFGLFGYWSYAVLSKHMYVSE